MQTRGRMKVVKFEEERAIVEVINCKNLDDDGQLMGPAHDVAYYNIYAASKQEAIDEIRKGRGEFLGTDFPE